MTDQNQAPQNQPGQPHHTGNQPIDAARDMAEQQIDQAIDQFAQKIPGGTQFTQQAKDAASGILDNLETEAGKHLGDVGGLLGGLFGNHQEKKP